ncbi:phosphatase PAP2 family protein [Gallicola sp. Sow4_E12]|uniref:phosphatase PAP2 family protein n=1 Tax=Gallicola sp. Sow4_E12 TaxID=3438785 RepID=UPI003F923908
MKAYERWYEGIEQYFRKWEMLFDLLVFFNTWIPRLVYISYPLLLLFLIFTKDERAVKVLLVPFAAFLFTTIIRKVKNEPRPYEKYTIRPLIPREKKGESFPSRHTLSILIIAMAFLYINTALGILFLLLGVLLGIVRVAAGIHFPRDVIAAALISLIFGLIGFF